MIHITPKIQPRLFISVNCACNLGRSRKDCHLPPSILFSALPPDKHHKPASIYQLFYFHSSDLCKRRGFEKYFKRRLEIDSPAIMNERKNYFMRSYMDAVKETMLVMDKTEKGTQIEC